MAAHVLVSLFVGAALLFLWMAFEPNEKNISQYQPGAIPGANARTTLSADYARLAGHVRQSLHLGGGNER